jgi:hypothetical protein
MGALKFQFNAEGKALDLTYFPVGSRASDKSPSDPLLHITNKEHGMLFDQHLGDGRHLQVISTTVIGNSGLWLARYMLDGKPSTCTRIKDSFGIYAAFDINDDPETRAAIEEQGPNFKRMINESRAHIQSRAIPGPMDLFKAGQLYLH